jgi:hypothetical protein
MGDKSAAAAAAAAAAAEPITPGTEEMSAMDKLAWNMTLSKKNNLPWAAAKGYNKTLIWCGPVAASDARASHLIPPTGCSKSSVWIRTVSTAARTRLSKPWSMPRPSAPRPSLRTAPTPTSRTSTTFRLSTLQSPISLWTLSAILSKFVQSCRPIIVSHSQSRLLQLGARTDELDEEGNTILMCACITGNAKVVSILAKSGCDLRRENKDGESPLQHATVHGHNDVVVVLLRSGLNKEDIEKKNRNGKSCIDLAYDHKRNKIGKLFERVIGSDPSRSRFEDEKKGEELNIESFDEEGARLRRRQSSVMIFQKLLEQYKIEKDPATVTEDDLRQLGVKDSHIPRLMEAVKLQAARNQAKNAAGALPEADE